MVLLRLLVFGQIVVGFVTGQFDDSILPDLDRYSAIQKPEEYVADFVPLRKEKERPFLEALVIEAGRHVLFPELYTSDAVPSSVLEEPIRPTDYPMPQTPVLPRLEENPLIGRVPSILDDVRYKPDSLNVFRPESNPTDSFVVDFAKQVGASDVEKLSQKVKGGVESTMFSELGGQPEEGDSYLTRDRRSDFDCPDDCPVYKPVCGSDGKIYPSECHMLKENCGEAIVTSGPWEVCKGKHYLCPSRCLKLVDPVCGSDSKIYPNICIMRQRNCGKLLRVVPIRNCLEEYQKSVGENVCPKKCPGVMKPVCGSDGELYFNECFLKRFTCGKGVAPVKLENCVKVHACPERCVPIYDPSCGSDGVLYLNKCIMLSSNCGKSVSKMPLSFCSSGVQGSDS